MTNTMSMTRSLVIVVSFVLVVSMITNTALTRGYAVAQTNSTSKMSSATVTNSSMSTSKAQTSSPYKFERGYPALGTADRAYNDTDLGRAVEAFKFFYPTMASEGILQDMSEVAKPNQGAVKVAARPRHEIFH